jgi:hypothetical protein
MLPPFSFCSDGGRRRSPPRNYGRDRYHHFSPCFVHLTLLACISCAVPCYLRFVYFAQSSYRYFAGLLGVVMTIVTAAMVGAPRLPDAARLLAAVAAGLGLPIAAAAAATEAVTGPPLVEGIREEAGAGLLLRVIGRPAPVLLEIDDWTNPASSNEEAACSHSPSSGHHQHGLISRVVRPVKSVT